MKVQILALGGLAAAVMLLARQASADTAVNLEAFMGITQDPASWPAGDRIWDVCRAIARAEGYDRGPGAAPFNLNNPGDLSPGDEASFPLAGDAQFHGGSYVLHFATPDDGWHALYNKISRIVRGHSTVYQAGWSWEQIGATYTGGANGVVWGRNVAAALGVDPGSTLADYVGV